MPELFLVLRRNMTAEDIVNNEKALKDEANKEVQQQEAEQEAQDKKQREEEEARMKELKHQKKMDKYRKKFERKQCFIGFINFAMIIGLLAALLSSTETFSRNLESLQMRLSVQEIIIPACTEVEDEVRNVKRYECREDKDVIYLRYTTKNEDPTAEVVEN